MSFKSFNMMTLFILLLLPEPVGIAFIMPEAVERGKPVRIRCLHTLDRKQIYQVEWYRAQHMVQVQIFPIPGIDVDALSEHVWYRVSGGTNGNLWTTYSTLQFVVRKHNIIEFRIRIRCAATMYSAFYKSTEKSAEAEIIGTIAPHTWTQRTSAYPPTKHRISQNSASWNPKNLWTVWLEIWEKLIELLQGIFYMKR